MSDIRYSVEIAYFSSGRVDTGINQLQRGTDAWHSGMLSKIGGQADALVGGFNGAFDSVATTAISALTTVAAMGGSAMAAALGHAVREGLSFANFQEQATIGLATVRSMLADQPIDVAMRGSAESVERLRVLAKELPGSMRDVVNAFSYLQPAALGLGVGADRLEKLAAHGVAAAAAVGVAQGTAGHELAAMLEGRASSRMPMVAKLGFHAKELNAMDPTKRFEAVEARLAKTGPAIDLYKQSWAGLTSNAEDTARQLAKTMADPLFGSIKGSLGRALDWASLNSEKLDVWATVLGNGLDRVFHNTLDFIQHWYPFANVFVHTIGNGLHNAFSRIGPFLERFEGVAERFLSDPKAFDKIVHVASSLAALRAGTGMLGSGIGFGLRNFEGIGSALEGVGVGAAELGVAAPLAAAGIVGLALATEGAVHALTDSSSAFHGIATNQVKSIGEHAAATSREMAHLNESTRDVRDGMGVVLLHWVDNAATSVELFTKAVNGFVDGWKQWGSDMGNIFNLRRPEVLGVTDDMTGALASAHKSIVDGVADTFEKTYSPLRAMSGGPNEGDTAIKAPHVTNHVTNHVTVNVESNADPNRIAEVVTDKLAKQQQRQRTFPSAALYP